MVTFLLILFGLGLPSFLPAGSQEVRKAETIQSPGEVGCRLSLGTGGRDTMSLQGGGHIQLWPVAVMCACGGARSQHVCMHTSP